MTYPLEMEFRPLQKGPSLLGTTPSSLDAFWGKVVLSSGSATAVVSNRLVNSDSVIMFSQLGNANVASGTAIRPLEIKTISPSSSGGQGGYFTFGTQDGQGIARDTTIMWELKKTS